MTRHMRLLTFVLAAGALPALFSVPARAVTSDQVKTCEREETGSDQRIASCTAIINDAAASVQQKANAFAIGARRIVQREMPLRRCATSTNQSSSIRTIVTRSTTAESSSASAETTTKRCRT
jgi:hypothetical protein